MTYAAKKRYIFIVFANPSPMNDSTNLRHGSAYLDRQDDWAAALLALAAAGILPEVPRSSSLCAALSNLIPQSRNVQTSLNLKNGDSPANTTLSLTCNRNHDDDRAPSIPGATAAVSRNALELHDAVARCVSEHPGIPRYLRPLSVLLITTEAVRHLVRRPGCTDGEAATGVCQDPQGEAPSMAAMLSFVQPQPQPLEAPPSGKTESKKRSNESEEYDATTATVNNAGAAADSFNDGDDSPSYGRDHKRRRVDAEQDGPCCRSAVDQDVAAASSPEEEVVVSEPTLVQCHAEMRQQDAKLLAYLREFTEVVALELGEHLNEIAAEGKEASEALSYLQRELDAHLAMLLGGVSEEAATATEAATPTATAATVTVSTNLSSTAHAGSLGPLPQWLSKAREFAEKYRCPNLDLAARLLDTLVTAIELVEDTGFEAALLYLAHHTVVLCRDDLKIHADPVCVDVSPEGTSLPISLQEICRTITATATTSTVTTEIPATSSNFILTPAGAASATGALGMPERPMGQQHAIRYRFVPRPLKLLVRWKLAKLHSPAQGTVQLGLSPVGPGFPYPGWNPMVPTRGSNPAAAPSCTDIASRVSKLLKDLLVPEEGSSFLHSVCHSHSHLNHHFNHLNHQQQQQQDPGGLSDTDSEIAVVAMEAAVRKCFSSLIDIGSRKGYTCKKFWTLVSYLQRYRNKPNFHGIVFVRTRQAALFLADMMRRTKELQFLQEPGRKVLVATSAAEEGLDVPSCEFVVRYNAHVCGIGQRLVRDGNGWRIYSDAGRRLLRGVAEVCDIVISGSGVAS
ncbi:hypothetical protein Vretifemale_19553 [Volvox reticuliferus]|uniref:Helicase C-terminal domain-containing protein n=2 Tax=Volvox reticuliferus TaxID=1737510 RepID=A0A8J4CZA1_9CHLO|nr:hypothetical protein Vretifemale_19553 [Volvox reticuliferus]